MLKYLNHSFGIESGHDSGICFWDWFFVGLSMFFEATKARITCSRNNEFLILIKWIFRKRIEIDWNWYTERILVKVTIINPFNYWKNTFCINQYVSIFKLISQHWWLPILPLCVSCFLRTCQQQGISLLFLGKSL